MATSLQKSHSKASNAKLTFICILAAICFTALWVGIVLLNKYLTIGLITTISSAVLLLGSFILISKFSRG